MAEFFQSIKKGISRAVRAPAREAFSEQYAQAREGVSCFSKTNPMEDAVKARTAKMAMRRRCHPLKVCELHANVVFGFLLDSTHGR